MDNWSGSKWFAVEQVLSVFDYVFFSVLPNDHIEIYLESGSVHDERKEKCKKNEK